MRFLLASITLALIIGCNQPPPERSAPYAPVKTAKQLLEKPNPHLAMNKLPPLPSGEIVGQLELSEDLKDSVQPGDPIFLIARSAATGSTLAVARLEVPKQFPLAFRLSGENVMMAGRSLAGKVKVLARIDKDGEALSKKPGDITGEVEGIIEVPAKGVVLVLNKML